MLSIVDRFDRQLEEAVEIGERFDPGPILGPIQSVVACGLGGSAIGADLLRSFYLNRISFPLLVNRGYRLPGFVDENTLVLACSYSGNTEETLSAYQDAENRRAQIVCVTSGGSLERRATEAGYPVVKVPGGMPPRTALGYSMVPLLSVLHKMDLTHNWIDEVNEAVNTVRARLGDYRLDVPFDDNPAKQLAANLWGRVTVVYGSQDRLENIARRWSGQFNENSKQLSYFSSIPEMNHNEVVGWKHPADHLRQLNLVFLRDRDDHHQIQRRISVNRQDLGSLAGYCTEVWTDRGGWFSRLMGLTILADYTSIYLAFLNGEDPTPVKAIDLLKARLMSS